MAFETLQEMWHGPFVGEPGFHSGMIFDEDGNEVAQFRREFFAELPEDREEDVRR